MYWIDIWYIVMYDQLWFIKEISHLCIIYFTCFSQQNCEVQILIIMKVENIYKKVPVWNYKFSVDYEIYLKIS